jgi:hypothetical protein
LRARGSETEEELLKRLNLGDAHVALILIMSGRAGEMKDFIEPKLAEAITTFMDKTKKGEDVSAEASFIKDFTKSENVVTTISELAKTDTTESNGLIDKVVTFDEKHRIASGDTTPVTETLFFKEGVSMIKDALSK